MEAPMVPRGGLIRYVRSGYKRLRLADVREQAGSPFSAMVRSYTRRRTAPSLRKRKKSRRRGRGRIGRVPFTWPRLKLVRFKVVSMFNYTEADPGNTVQYLIMANSLSDPHGAISSNLPLGLDQWAAMYRKYCVVGSKHYVKVHNVDSTGAVAYGLTLRNPDETALLANPEAYMENSQTRSRILSPDMDHSGVGISYSAKKYWHTPKLITKEDLHGDFSTTPGAPSDMAYISLWFGDVTKTKGYTVEGYVTSEYTVLLFDAIQPARSAA